jgi:hypothetical protein
LQETFAQTLGFFISFSAVNPCETRNRYLLLLSDPSTSGTEESPDYPVICLQGLKMNVLNGIRDRGM